MHETDPEETMGPRDATAADQAMDPEALNVPGRIAPEDTSAIPSDAATPDAMGEPRQPAPDVMGAPMPETDETLGDRTEADRR